MKVEQLKVRLNEIIWDVFKGKITPEQARKLEFEIFYLCREIEKNGLETKEKENVPVS